MGQKLHVALIEDNEGDARLFHELCLNEHDADVVTLKDGEQALDYLYRRGEHGQATRPSLIVLDLNIPKIHGLTVLEQIKNDRDLKEIPVVIFSTSDATSDVLTSYDLRANCYLRKPGTLEEYEHACMSLKHFWFRVAALPDKGTRPPRVPNVPAA